MIGIYRGEIIPSEVEENEKQVDSDGEEEMEDEEEEEGDEDAVISRWDREVGHAWFERAVIPDGGEFACGGIDEHRHHSARAVNCAEAEAGCERAREITH